MFYICRFFVTCGNDGDVRIWEGLDDDDPKFITVGEKVYSLALKVGQTWEKSDGRSANERRAHTSLLSAEREAGDGELQQHGADPHLS